MNIKQFLRLLAFLLVLALVCTGVLNLFSKPSGIFSQSYNAFKEMEDNSLDAVFIGASGVYRGWSSMLAYNDYGMTVMPITSDGLPMSAVQFIIEDVRKTQPDTLFIIDYRTSRRDVYLTEGYIRNITDTIQDPVIKKKAVDYMLDLSGLQTEFDRWEYYFSFMLYHNRWIEGFEPSDFDPDNITNPFCGTVLGKTVPFRVKKVSQPAPATDKRLPLGPKQEKELTDLLAYLQENHIDNVLFTIVPYACTEAERATFNTATDMIQAAGFETVDLHDHVDAMGLSGQTDFYNGGHTNQSGTVKITDYFARYLDAKYDFEDHRGDPAYANWDSAYTKYIETIEQYRKAYEKAHPTG